VSYLLDTCLLSELWKPAPNGGALAWTESVDEDELYLSVLTLGELTRGVEGLPHGKRRQRLARDYQALRSRFAERILPVTPAVSERWGAISARARSVGRSVHVVDGLLAATALQAGLTVVTRNVQDFEVTQVVLVNPWT
jgi:toxin FitB